MEIEYTLYMQQTLNEPEFCEYLNKFNIRIEYFDSMKHHPRAILLHRTRFSKKVISSEYEKSCSKVAIIYLTNLSSFQELEDLSLFFPLYLQNNIKILILIQGAGDMIESLAFKSASQLPKEYYEEWLSKCMVRGIDCIETDSCKESATTVHRILKILTNSPYKPEASIYRLQSKKLQANTEIPCEQKEWAQQLVNIPGISETKALRIISKFPTLQSLFEYYQNSSISTKEKKSFFTGLSERKEKRLSDKMYTVYNSLNPDEIV